jgi:Xaa-Pro aminopeptidase
MSRNKLPSLRKLLKINKIDALLIKSEPNLRYFCGFTGTTGLLWIDADNAFFLTDSRYTEQARQQVDNALVEEVGNPILGLRKKIKATGASRLGFEADAFTIGETYRFSNEMGLVTKPVHNVMAARMRKTKSEIDDLRRAVEIAEGSFKLLAAAAQTAKSERDLAVLFETSCRMAGSRTEAFPTIVASGHRSAMPHGIASDKRIENGDLVIVDFGAEHNGYFSDQTCVLVAGKPTARQKKVHGIVYDAQRKAIDAIRPGVRAGEIDRVARTYIDKAGFGDKFGHGTGHGIGLQVHEQPIISPIADTVLLPGMVFTVEPGIYLPGWGGVRLEDMVLVTNKGAERLTTLDKQLYRIA